MLAHTRATHHATPHATRLSVSLFAFTIFVSAFLLFQVQPMIAKMILPWFGGSSAVWSTCMLFFQLVLLGGYVYSHWLHGLPGRRAAIVHTVLLLASLAVLPILPNPSWKPTGGGNPSFLILGLLSITIGLPYFMLSTTGPLLQAWYSRSIGAVPYRLFALSNLASMLALLSYPIAIEPNLAVKTQSWGWSFGYAGFALACIATAWFATRGRQLAELAPDRGEAPTWQVRALWISLAACASALLLSVTTFLTQDIAAIPFLWILPLSVYLLSFIVAFESPRLYHRGIFMPLLVAALAGFGYFLQPQAIRIQIVPTLILLGAALFVCCMVCHGELARIKPHPGRLTGYYVMIAIGGAIGGLFVGLVAPSLFNAYYEFPIGLALCGTLAVIMLIRQGVGKVYALAMSAALLLYIGALGAITRDSVIDNLAVVRNFYGELRVFDEGEDKDPDADRKLLHGRINHGIQMRNEKYRRTPVAYFCSSSGIGHAMLSRPAGVPWKVGILGLGAGALAAWGQAGDEFRIYEINPLILELAQSQFTYLKDTPAKLTVSLGDGRLSLEGEPNQNFNLLVMDAFSGDSVPVHLITQEAFATYFRHLKPGGMLAVNITNRYLDLKPVMERLASHYGKEALEFQYSPKDEKEFLCNSSDWVVIVDRTGDLPASLKTGEVLKPYPDFHIWTDDFSNMFSILK